MFMLTFDYPRNNLKFAVNGNLSRNIGFLLTQVCSPVEIFAGNESDSVLLKKLAWTFGKLSFARCSEIQKMGRQG